MADRTVRAIVVEDDPSWQQILGEILSDSGLEVDTASSYAEALDLLRRAPHRLAVLDLSLGGPDHHNQDGLRVAEAVRRHDPTCSILFLTGFATVELAVQVMQELGALTCLRKEVFRRSDFRKVVNQALAQAPIDPAATGERGTENAGHSEGDGASRDPERTSQSLALIIEDDAGWRSLFEELLCDAGFQVRASGSYVEALGLIKHDPPQLAVVDLSLASSLNGENLDGYRLLTTLQKAGIPAIVVSGYVDPQRIEQAYREKLIYACLEKQAFDRKSFLQTVNDAKSQAAEDPVLKQLTDREREVLALLARGLTNKEIARHLTITPNTVKRHLKSLFAKLGVNTRSAASAKAISLKVDQD